MTGPGDPSRPFPRGLRLRFAAAVALMAATLLAGTALLGVAGGFITACALAAGTASGFNFFSPSAGIRALTFARIASRYFEKIAAHDATLRLARDVRTWFFRRALPLAPGRLGWARTGVLMSRLLDDIERVEARLVRGLGPLLALAVLSLAALAWTAWALPPAGLVLAAAMAVIAPAAALPVLWKGKARESRDARLQERLRVRVHEGIEGAADLAALDAGATWTARVDAAAARVARSRRQRLRRSSLATLVASLAGAAALVAVVALSLQAAHLARITPATAAALCFATLALLEAWAGVGLAWQALLAARTSERRLHGILARSPVATDPPQPLPVPDQGALELECVRFAHPGGRLLLRDASLRLEPGARVVVAGDSGSGKSTLLALVLRILDPQGGRVAWAGIDLRRLGQACWHSRLAWLPQDAPVFAGSVRANLAMGDPRAGDQALWAVLEAMRLDARVRAAGGLDCEVGEGGALLSAGEARRLALARALLRPAPLVLLDEPVEGLDVDAAEALLLDLEQALGARGLLLVSHAPVPATLPWRRLRLEQGRLREG
jgi:thiol reductant ABC exporter, CydC subunit